MGHASTKGVIIYWNLDQNFNIKISHHDWFDEYNSCLSIQDKQNLGSLLLQQYPEIICHN